MERMKTRLKRVFLFMLSALMLFTSLPLSVFAEVNYNYDDLTDKKSEIVNKLTPVKPAKPENGKTAEDLIKNPKQPDIYTLRTDYKVQRGEKYQVDYQPYIASVGEAASQAEKDKVNKTMDLPDIAGYDKPQENFTIDYNTVKGASDGKNKEGNDINGFRYSANKEFNYSAKSNKIKIKHVFQKLDDFTKYTNPDGTITQSDGSKGTLIKKGETRSEEVTIEEVEKHELIITQNGNTGSTMQASPLSESDPRRKGFIPEADYINMQVPQNAENFVLEYRYNRAHYDVVFDTAGGTPLPTRTLYYGQAMPKIADADIPTKVGGEFQGWKPSVDLNTSDGKTFKANEIIKVGTNEASKNLDANLIMPASKVTFTAVWKDKKKADYAVQFWAEKADHAEGASLMNKYDYMGTRVYKDKDTGMRPDLDNEPVKGLKFPDLDQARLDKIWANVRFNRDHDLYLNKFFVYNEKLTKEQNKDEKEPTMTKAVSATGKTVYNIYYDRQVYDLYFTKSNAQPDKNTIYPEIWGYDPAKGEAVMLGGPGKPYHYKARFNEMMYKWPNDAKQTKGFTPGYQSFGWGPNYGESNWPLHLDTPPYRLNAEEFLDMEKYTKWGGYTKNIDKGDGTTMDLEWYDFTTLSFGIKQDHPSIPHHMDFWMDGFKKGETIIRYDLVRTKADTAGMGYGHRYPKVTGFTPYGYDPKKQWPSIAEGSQENGRVNEDDINELNDERDEITPNTCGSYYNNQGIKLPIGQLDFIPNFFSDSDEYGDVKEGGQEFKENGYLQFKYTRNKYPLRFNYDPSIIRDDSYFNSKNQLDTFYQFPLKVLSPDLVPDGTERKDREYFKEDPKNFLDNPENLKKLGLTDLVFTNPRDGKLKVKRPDNLSDQMVFKGWALDPAGTKLIWENPGEKMPSHPVNLYAKWGEPDYQWKVTFDPNGGNLSSIDEAKVTQKRKTIQVGDKGQEETKTFAQKEKNEDDKQIFTVIQRQKLVEPPKPTKKGYDFMGWEAIRYTKDAKGDYTDQIDDSYRKTYKVPELYSFGNDVVSPIYLKAIWVPNDRVDVKVEHHILSLDLSKETEMRPETLYGKRTGYLVATSGDQQNEKYILATHKELEEKLTGDLKKLYEEYNERVKADNTYFQTFKVEPEKIPDPEDSSKMIDNPKAKDNVFHFFYRPFRTRDYKVNYIDERGKAEVEKFFTTLKLTDTSGLKDEALLKANEENKKKFEDKRTDFEELIKKHQIIAPEAVSNGNRHYDARNYRRIPGWVLADNEKSQQQLFFDVNEKTNEFLGINGTGSDQIFFYYKDVRVIETKKDDPTPDGYVRVTFKAEKGGSFKDKDGKEVTELYYDVIKGLQSQLLPVPQEWVGGKNDDGSEKQKEEGKYYITPETGKKFIKWDNKPLLNDNTIIKEAHTFTAYFEWSGLSASGLVRTEAFKDPENKWTNDFAPKIEDLKKQLVWREKGEEKSLPTEAVIKLYDEAGTKLTTDDQVYDLVKEIGKADNEELIRTVNIKAKVTFTDGKDPQELDIPIKVYKNVYEALTTGKKPLFLSEAEKKEAKDGGLKDITGEYVKVTVAPTGDMNSKDNKVYYVNPKAWVEISNDSNGTAALINWTADQDAQNENKAANGKFDFAKRHKFTKDTVISPRLSQTSELVVHESYKDSKNKWVNDFIDKELTDANLKAAIQVKNGEVKALGDGDTVTIVDDAGNPYADDAALKAALYEKLQEKDDGGKVSRIENIKVKVTFANGEVQTVTVPVKVIKNIYQAKTEAGMPDYVPANYVKVTLDPTTKAKDPQKYFYYVNPDAKVLIPGKDPEGVKEDFTGWTMKADSATGAGTSYKLSERHQFAEDSTIIAQYGQGKVRIKYVDENKKEIDTKYHIDGVDYPTEKIGKLGDNVPDPAYNQEAEKAAAPKFKGYIISNVSVDKKPANYTDPATATITYQYNKKVTTDDKSSSMAHFPVVFDANTGAFTGGEAKVTVYVYCKGSGETYEDVTFEEVRQAVEEKYGIPSKADESFIEWQDKDTKGTKVDAGYVIKLKDPNNWDVAEVFYANYGKASALVKYLDLNGKPIDDKFKIDGVEYPSEKAGTADEAIPSDVFTKDSAPKFTGYKFNRIELNPKDGKYALSKKATIKIYYEKDSDVIPAKDGSGNPNEKPNGYVEVKFVAGKNGKIQEKGADITEKVYYVNPAKYVNLTPPTTVPNTSYEFSTWCSEGKDFILANNINYTKDTIITAKFNTKGDVIPKTKSDDSEKPQGFVTVTFVIDPTEAGQIEAGQTTTYFVRPHTDLTIQPPKTTANTGYEFEKWDPDTTEAKQYTTDTTVKGEFKKLVDIIPSKNPDGTVNAKPEGYVIVNFLKGDHGVLDGQTTFYVNPKANKTIKDINPTITVVPSPTYKFDSWDTDFATVIDKDTKVTAKYTQLPNIIKAGPKDTAPAGYIVIIFETDGRGTITGNAAYEKTPPASKENEIVYFVNPKKGIKLAKLADGTTPTADQLAVPSTTPNNPDKYIFDQWRADIDTETPITRGRVHIAMFKPKEVKLTYDKNGADVTGDVPPVLTVDYDTNVRLAGKGDLAKKDASFKGWKIGDKIYQAGDQINLKEDKKAYAQWDDDKKIIEYNPVNNPTTRPDDTYVRVTFAADDGLKLTEQKAYYVKKDAGITLAQLTKPAYDVKTGYVFKEWDKADTDTITTDLLVTAKSTKLGTVIPEKDTNGNKNAKPEGYKEVVFKVKDADATKGSLEGNTKFYVNPTEYVTINPPTTKANTGYEFGAWDKDATRPTVYAEDLTTITASFNDLKDLIPKTNLDGSQNTKPDGYKTVTFVIDPATGGKIVKDEVTVYYVNPAKDVTLPQPKTLADTGYVFEKWDQDTATAKKYAADTTVKGNFKKLDDIIDGSKPRPDGYVKVTFDKGEHGALTGQSVYYVNPKAGKTIADLTKPTVKAETGWKQKAGADAWDTLDSTKITGPADIVVKAQYDAIPDVIEEKPGVTKPEGYFTVTFSTETNGKIKDTTDTTKVLYVNPNKAHVLKPYAPTVDPNTGYDFADWDTQIDKRIQYKDNDVIKGLYNTKGDVIPQKQANGSDKPAGYLKVIFDKGDHGNLTGKTVYYVNPNKVVTVPAPTVTASVGYEFSKWDKELKQQFTEDTTTITAEYKPLEDIVPQKNTDGSDRPFGYITVTFKADANGSLEGKTVYYVNPEKIVDLTSTADAITKNPNTGYTAEGGTWDKTLKAKFKDGDVITFNFKALDDVIEEKPGVTKPDGYVTVKFIPTDKATDTKEKVYFVNPLKKVTITEEPTGTKVKDANDVSYDYTFTGWTVTRGAINSWKGSSVSYKFIQDTDITAKYSVTLGNIMPLPLAKDNAVTAINDTPEAKDLIKNPSDLPQGTTFAYADNGQPKVDQAGNVNAKVKVTYPNGKTSIVTVPITVVDHVVPQIGGEDGQKPLVPEAYVKVTVDTTDKATPNTMFTKVFWVKPNVEVTIPGILAPTGKVVEEDGVKKTNNFIKWISSDDKKEYKDTIKDTFTKDTKITADYEFNKNTDPVGKDNLWFSLNSKPGPKDFIKNAYDDNNPDAVGALPPGTKFAFKDGIEPNTSKAGGNTATISVTYPNGEVKDIKVNYNVTGDVVEIENGVEKPPVPDNFVTVIVKTTDKATEDVTRTFRVNPEKVVDILVNNPNGKKVDKTQTSPDIQYVFKGWQSDENPVRTWSESISGQFTAKVTTITAQYEENIGQPGIVDAGMYYTSESLKGVNNYLPSEDELKALVKSQVQGDIEEVSILTNDFDSEVYNKLKENGKLDREEISRTEIIKAKITFVNGSTKEIDIPIVVYKNIYEGLTNGAKPQYVVQAEHDLRISNPNRDDNVYVRVTLIPTAKAKNQQRKTYYVRKNASVIIPEIIAEGRDAYEFIYWKAEKPGEGQDNPNYGWATRAMSMFRAPSSTPKDDLVENDQRVNFDGRMSFDQDTDIVAQYKTTTPTPTPDEPDKPNPDYPNYPEYRPNYSGGSTIYIEKPVEKVIKVPVTDNAFVKEVRYMQGFKGKFRPFDGLTRAEAAQILANALKEDGYKYDPNYKISYKDIGNAWYTEAVKIVTQANVFKGYDDGNFKPQEKITRAEWIGTLKRFQELSDLSGNHMNLREGHWAMAEIEAAYQAGWLAIYSDGLADFKADEFIPRQEVAAVSNKAFERVLDKTYIKRNDKALVNYKDINDKMWSYEDILCASNTFLHDKKLYRAHGIDMSNEIFNINLDGFTITKDKFQRIER